MIWTHFPAISGASRKIPVIFPPGLLRLRATPLAIGSDSRSTATTGSVVEARGSVRRADLYLLAAVVVCGLGYAEGGVLSRALGAPQTICWALLLALPITAPVAALSIPSRTPGIDALLGFAYVSTCSMFLGFFCWYAGLARGGVAHVSQLQLGQTPLTLLWSAIVLGEPIGLGTGIVALAALLTVLATQRTRVRTSAPADVEADHGPEMSLT